MFLTTDYVSIAINGHRLTSLAQSALPDAPVVSEPERAPFLARVRRLTARTARIITTNPSPATRQDAAPVQG
jgi:hypothetical protein